MFEILNEVPESVATTAVYGVMLRLYVRSRFPEALERGEAVPGTEKETEREREVVAAILDEIRCREGKSIPDLTEDEAGRYTIQLGDIMTARSKARPGYDPERGRALLEELRRDYPPPRGFAA